MNPFKPTLVKLVMNTVSIEEIIQLVLDEHDGVVVGENWGERGLFYNPGLVLPKGVYILTFKEKDGDNDSASNLNRPNTYRLNLKVQKQDYIERFGEIPTRPAAGNIVDTGHDFTMSNVIMPHPVYAWMTWICINNPESDRLEDLTSLIKDAHRMAMKKFKQRTKNL